MSQLVDFHEILFEWHTTGHCPASYFLILYHQWCCHDSRPEWTFEPAAKFGDTRCTFLKLCVLKDHSLFGIYTYFPKALTAPTRPWPLLQFRNHFFTQTVGLRGPLPIHRTTQTQNKHIHRHPCLEWDLNPRSQHSSKRRLRSPLWSSGQSFWLQIQRSRVWFPALPDFPRSRGSGTGSTQPRKDNWGPTWKKNTGSGVENRD
jgi:hypothetical protein